MSRCRTRGYEPHRHSPPSNLTGYPRAPFGATAAIYPAGADRERLLVRVFVSQSRPVVTVVETAPLRPTARVP